MPASLIVAVGPAIRPSPLRSSDYLNGGELPATLDDTVTGIGAGLSGLRREYPHEGPQAFKPGVIGEAGFSPGADRLSASRTVRGTSSTTGFGPP